MKPATRWKTSQDLEERSRIIYNSNRRRGEGLKVRFSRRGNCTQGKFIKFKKTIYLGLECDDLPQFPQESPEEWDHRAFRHSQRAGKREFILGWQKGGGEAFQNWYRLVHAVPKGLQLVGPASKALVVFGWIRFEMIRMKNWIVVDLCVFLLSWNRMISIKIW